MASANMLSSRSSHSSEFDLGIEEHFCMNGDDFDFDLSSNERDDEHSEFSDEIQDQLAGEEGGEEEDVFNPPEMRTDAEYSARDRQFKERQNNITESYSLDQRNDKDDRQAKAMYEICASTVQGNAPTTQTDALDKGMALSMGVMGSQKHVPLEMQQRSLSSWPLEFHRATSDTLSRVGSGPLVAATPGSLERSGSARNLARDRMGLPTMMRPIGEKQGNTVVRSPTRLLPDSLTKLPMHSLLRFPTTASKTPFDSFTRLPMIAPSQTPAEFMVRTPATPMSTKKPLSSSLSMKRPLNTAAAAKGIPPSSSEASNCRDFGIVSPNSSKTAFKLLAHMHGIPAAPAEQTLKVSHTFWSRLEKFRCPQSQV